MADKTINVQIKNLPQIRAAFSKSPFLMTKNLNKAIGKVYFKVKSRSISITPEDTGFLKRSHEYGSYLSNLKAVIHPNAKYAWYVHEGKGTNFRKGPRPFLENAVEFEQGFIDDEFVKAVDTTLDEIARKINHG